MVSPDEGFIGELLELRLTDRLHPCIVISAVLLSEQILLGTFALRIAEYEPGATKLPFVSLPSPATETEVPKPLYVLPKIFTVHSTVLLYASITEPERFNGWQRLGLNISPERLVVVRLHWHFWCSTLQTLTQKPFTESGNVTGLPATSTRPVVGVGSHELQIGLPKW
ncbi:MAG: hypothetical protein A2X80_07760 [Geobacteraceae bacterium GWB2_52_12]|nr:MAG: hypothetical protein A2X80_07760 [Geobacteraceae bacterium GWB2_52_12]